MRELTLTQAFLFVISVLVLFVGSIVRRLRNLGPWAGYAEGPGLSLPWPPGSRSSSGPISLCGSYSRRRSL